MDASVAAGGPAARQYSGATVLLTGAAGFLGKVVLERILWDLPQVAQLRLLIRQGKQYASPQERFEAEVLSSPIFARLRERHGGHESLVALAREKIRVFGGDLSLERFGMADQQYEDLSRNLDLVIHSAALVDWGERLDLHIQNNTLAARRMLNLAKDAGARVLHVSTAWVNGMQRGLCVERAPEFIGDLDIDDEAQTIFAFAAETEAQSQRAEVREELYREAKLRGNPAHKAANGKDKTLEAAFEALRARWVQRRIAEWGVQRARTKGHCDNYTYSKALAEAVFGKEHGGVPCAIVRPSGISSALRDPAPGWTDAYLLTEPLIEGVGKRNITEFPGNPQCVIDTIPVDLVVNVILVAGSSLLQKSSVLPSAAVPVYQVASGDTNPLTLGEIEQLWRSYFEQQPFKQASSGAPITGLRPVVFWESTDEFAAALRRRYVTPLQFAQRAVEAVPGWQNIGPLRTARGAATRRWRTVEKVLQLANLYSNYTLNEWQFQTTETQRMMSELDPADQAVFPYDPQQIDWKAFWTEKHIPGMRRYVLKEPGFAIADPSVSAHSRL